MLGLFALAIAVVYRRELGLPPELDPSAPLDVAAEPNWLTRFKLARAAADPRRCLLALGGTQLSFTVLEDRVIGAGCGFDNAVLVERGTAEYSEPFSLSCRAALPLAQWERHVLQPEARRLFGSAVSRIEHFGSYACRNIYGRRDASRSAHATADALDVAGFVLADGRRIRVLADYAAAPALRGEPREAERSLRAAEFLRRVRSGACEYFDVVLGPDYNAAHRDHFHLEAGARFRVCR